LPDVSRTGQRTGKSSDGSEDVFTLLKGKKKREKESLGQRGVAGEKHKLNAPFLAPKRSYLRMSQKRRRGGHQKLTCDHVTR